GGVPRVTATRVSPVCRGRGNGRGRLRRMAGPATTGSGTLGDMSALQDSAPNRDRRHGAGREQLGRIGLWTGSLEGLTPARIPDVLGELDDQGWGSLWFGEAAG